MKIIEFLGKLGIDPKILIAQLINFGVLLWLLSRFLYKPLVKHIEKGELELKAAQTEKEKLEHDREDLEKQKKKELSDSHQKAEQIIEEAQNIAGALRRESQKEIEDEKQKVLEQIRSRLKTDEKNK